MLLSTGHLSTDVAATVWVTSSPPLSFNSLEDANANVENDKYKYEEEDGGDD